MYSDVHVAAKIQHIFDRSTENLSKDFYVITDINVLDNSRVVVLFCIHLVLKSNVVHERYSCSWKVTSLTVNVCKYCWQHFMIGRFIMQIFLNTLYD